MIFAVLQGFYEINLNILLLKKLNPALSEQMVLQWFFKQVQGSTWSHSQFELGWGFSKLYSAVKNPKRFIIQFWRTLKCSSYLHLWRTSTVSSSRYFLFLFTCEEPLKALQLFICEAPLKVIHRIMKNYWRFFTGKRWRTLRGSLLTCYEPIMVLHNNIRLLNFSWKCASIV